MTPDDLPGPTVDVSVPVELHAWCWETAWDFDCDRPRDLGDDQPCSEFESFDALVEAAGERLEELLEVWVKLYCPQAERVQLGFKADSRRRHRPVLIVDGQEVEMENGRFTPPNADMVSPEDVGAPGQEVIDGTVGDFLQEPKFFTQTPVEIVVSNLDIIVAARAMEWLSQGVGDTALASRGRLVKNIADHLASRLNRRPKQHVQRLPYLTPDERNDLTSAMARLRDWGLIDQEAVQPHVEAAFQEARQGQGRFGARFVSVDRWISVLGDLAEMDFYRPDTGQVADLLSHDNPEVREATLYHLVPHLNVGALADHSQPCEERPSPTVHR